MSEESGGNRPLTSVKCETHGLRYNPNLHTGCARCRKEAGETIGQTGQIPVATGSAPAAGGGAAGSASAGDAATGLAALVPALGAAIVLVGLAGGGLFVVHQNWYDLAQESFGPGAFGEQYDDGYGADDYDEYDEYEKAGEADDYEVPKDRLSTEEEQELDELREELGKDVSDG